MAEIHDTAEVHDTAQAAAGDTADDTAAGDTTADDTTADDTTADDTTAGDTTAAEGRAQAGAGQDPTSPPPFAPGPQAAPSGPASYRRLLRGEGPISGVAGGLAEYFRVDPTIVRVGLVAGTLLGGPIVPIGYVAAWAIIPSAPPVPVPPVVTPPAPPAQLQDTPSVPDGPATAS